MMIISQTSDFGAKLANFAVKSDMTPVEAASAVLKSVNQPTRATLLLEGEVEIRAQYVRTIRGQPYYIIFSYDRKHRLIMLMDIETLDIALEKDAMRQPMQRLELKSLLLPILRLGILILSLIS